MEVAADTVHGRAAVDADGKRGDFGKNLRVVGLGEDCLGEVGADFCGRDVEGSAEFQVGDVVAAEVDMHQARDAVLVGRTPVEGDALDQRGGAVSNSCDGDPDLAHTLLLSEVGGTLLR